MKVLIWCPLFLQAQTRAIDSLKQFVYRSAGEKEKLQHILALCEEYKSLDRDTLDYYALEARKLAVSVQDIRSKGLAELAFANSYFRWGWMDSALVVLNAALKNYSPADPLTRDIYFMLIRQKAMCYGARSRFSEALAVLYQIVEEAEKYGDSITMASNMNTIGSVALARAQPAEALQWHYKALAFSGKDPRFAPVLAAVYVNMADAYSQINKSDSAEYYIKKGVMMFRQQQNLLNLALALQKMSGIYIKVRKLNEAETALKEMLEVRKLSSDGSMYVDDAKTLVDFYIESGQVDKAIQVCQDVLVKGDYENLNQGKHKTTVTNSNIRLIYYEALAKCYRLKGDAGRYQQALENLVLAKDSFYEANSASAIAELQTKYEVQKKENTIMQQNLDLTRKNYQLFGSATLLLFLLVVGYAAFVVYKKNQQLKIRRMLEEEKQVSLKAVADAKEKQRISIAADLHDNLGLQANAILYVTEQLRQQEQPKEELVNDLHDTAKDMMVNLRETLWAMKTADTTLAGVWMRITNFCRQIGRYYPDVIISVASHPPSEIPVDPVKGLNAVLIVQEAVNNSLRHSGASLISIKNRQDALSWIVSVEDNGKGFDMEEARRKKESYGLSNMKSRAADAAMKLGIESLPEKGTVITLSLPVERIPGAEG